MFCFNGTVDQLAMANSVRWYDQKDIMLMFSLNGSVDHLAMANSVRW